LEDLIARVTAFITSHGIWAGPIIGLLTFGESLAFIGMLIPATALMIAVGGLVGTGVLDPVPIFLWAVGGALLGDWLSYALGRWIGPSIYRRWPLNRHRPLVAKARLFFRKYGFVSIFFGRFLGPVRATIPLVAGVMQMERRPFQIANAASALLWVPALLAPGFLATRGLGSIDELNEVHLLGLGGASIVLTIIATAIGARIFGGDRKRARTRRVRAAEAAE